jgi:NAD(P)-dependent dehydrogenase (short-subunit alcohol dehydrogenase family)
MMNTKAATVLGRTIVITGATSGIGEVAAYSLAQTGARIVFIARDRVRGEETLKRLRQIAPAQEHVLHYADLSRVAELKRVAQEIAGNERKIDVLINNAGGLFSTRQVTQDGLEMTFATNHMAYFVITNMLIERLKVASGARVISTSSDAYKTARLNFSDLQSQHRYGGFGMYGRSKLMNILFTRELARRMAGTSVTANCFYPGFVATRFGDSGSGVLASVLKCAKRFALTAEEGAQTLIYLASSPAVAGISGKYFYKCRPVKLFRRAESDEDARRLWDVSVRLSGVG